MPAESARSRWHVGCCDLDVLNFNHLYYFHVAAAEGSIARAAEKLALAQPTVSEQVRQLERSLKVRLFDRTSTGLRLTDAGRQAYAHTSVMFQAAERLMGDLSGSTDMKQSLRVGISAAASRNVATDFLSPILQVPDCVPNIRTGDSMDLLRQLRAQELDLVLCEEQPPDAIADELNVTELHRPRLVVVAAPEHFDGDAAKTWSKLPMMTYLPGSPFRWEVDGFMQERAYKAEILAETDDAQFMLQSAIKGMCLAVVPRHVARRALAEGTLHLVEGLPAGPLALNAVFRDGRGHTFARRAVELLIAHAEGSGEDLAPKS